MSRFVLAALLVVVASQIPLIAIDDPLEKKTNFPSAFAGRRNAKDDGSWTRGSLVAIVRGLSWLAAQQRDDGSWRFDGSAIDDSIGATGLALLTYLGVGENHTDGSKWKEEVQKALKFLVSQQENTGKFKGQHTMYSHALATLALCEAYGMTKDKALFVPAQRAMFYILTGQARQGGWRYQAGVNDSDLSVTAWQVQALQAARFTEDIAVDERIVKKTHDYLDTLAGGRGGLYGYHEAVGKPGTAMTAAGLLCRHYFSEWNAKHAGMIEGVEGLLKARPTGDALPDMYFCYYATNVLYLYGGNEWKEWNEGPEKDGKRTGGVRELLIKTQIREGKNHGSWDPCPGSVGNAGRLCTTCFCLLTLEVYYRYVPVEKK